MALTALMPLAAQDDAPAPRPNVILILCDDLGYADIGCFGSERHRTPNIDRLADEGTRLTSFYSTSGVCTPSRSSVMTGCYPRRVNMHQSAKGEWVLFAVARKGLNPTEVTLAEVLREQGYATACIGKWHLGDQRPFLPTEQGFDCYFGIPYSNDMGARQRKGNPPLPLMRDTKVIEAPADQTTLTKRYTEEALAFIERERQGPFFLYLPHTFPHLPLFASDEFRGRSGNGKFADAVEEIDWSTGQIIDQLERLGLTDNTLVIFTSDNGAARRPGGSNAPLRGYKGSTWEGGMRVPCVLRWPAGIKAGTSNDNMASTLDLLPTLAALAGGPASTSKIDGLDIRAMLVGDAPDSAPRTTFLYYFKDQLRAVRTGRYKLHLARLEKDQEVAAQLFDLIDDIGESTDVAGEHADVVQRMQRIAAQARLELGDRGQQGQGQRPAAIMEDPRPLRQDSPR